MAPEDVGRIYDKLNEMAVTVGKLCTKFDERERPCNELKGHLKSHSEVRKAVIGGVVTITIAAIIATLALLMKLKGS